MRTAGIPKRLYSGNTAVRKVSTEGSPVAVAAVITPGPENRTFICDFENGANNANGERK
jgi:hypothetical protein